MKRMTLRQAVDYFDSITCEDSTDKSDSEQSEGECTPSGDEEIVSRMVMMGTVMVKFLY